MWRANRLRAFAWVCGTTVVVLAAWVSVRYDTGRPATLLGVALVGAALPGIPRAIARLRFAGRRGLGRLRARVGTSVGSSGKTTFRSRTAITDTEDTLDAISEAVQAEGAFDDVRVEEFPEGRGLTVVHTGFHNSFVRFASDDTIVVSGDSERTRDLKRLVARTCEIDLEGVRTNPNAEPTPVRGGARVALGAALAVIVVLAGVTAVGVAYPDTTYNPAEKATFVAIDTRAAIDPGYTRTEAALDKASLMVSSIREETAELAWQRDDSAAVVVGHTEEALSTAADVRRLLGTVRSGSPTSAQGARADRIAERLARAERRLAATIAARNRNLSDPALATVEARRRLLADANRTVPTTADA